MKIDLVYLWVDGVDSTWQKQRAPYLARENQSDSESFCTGRTTNSDELRYSLRSVEMYASWINHIFIVTDAQRPEWLDANNPKITVVDHRNIFSAEELPLYNSCAIELGIHRIKGLSEHYLYANDDMMFGRAMSPDFFFTKDGRLRCHFIKSNNLSKANSLESTYNNTIKKSIDTIKQDFGLECENWMPHHQIDAYTKSSVQECLEKYKEWCDSTIASRFRSRENMQRHILSLYAVTTGKAEAIFHSRPKLLNLKHLAINILGIKEGVSLVLSAHKKNARLKIKALRPSLLCFNDTLSTTDADREAMKELLEELYPTKSQFEKDSDTSSQKIDLVYLWVDGDDPEWRKRRAPYLENQDQSDSESFCAARTINNDELRYSLRSVEMYAPWINHIYIVTDAQCPKWLDTSNPKISIVDHREIFPTEILPLYSSRAIELGIHRIKGLSEHYLCANDDMMLSRAISPRFFFSKKGKVRCRFDTSKRLLFKDEDLETYMTTIKRVANNVADNYGLDCRMWSPSHNIDPYKKSCVSKCIDTYKTWYDKTLANKFRNKEDIQRHIFSLYSIATGDGEAIVKKRTSKFKRSIIKRSIRLGISPGVDYIYLAIHKENIEDAIKIFKPALICFNDSQRASNEDRAKIRTLMEKLYPTKSQFEKDSDTPSQKIDLVYLWVDGDDPEWQKKRVPYLENQDQSDSESFCAARTIDNDELRYSLRSVEMYAPWINHIYIVTDAQCLKWLNTENPKITVVDHREIFSPEILPLYNSCAIELGIHRIKGLSEHYLYANDDMMFSRAISPEFFFSKDGKVKCRFDISKRLLFKTEGLTTYMTTIKRVANNIAEDYGLDCWIWSPSHNIDPYKKSSVNKCIERYKEWYNETYTNRFRNKKDMQRHIFSLYSVATEDGVAILKKRANKFKRVLLKISIRYGKSPGVDYMYLAIDRKHLRYKIKNYRPALLCFNDSEKANDTHRTEIRDLLNELYPTKSQFEK